MENFNLRIDFLRFKKAALVNVKGKQGTKKCIIIPVEDNNLYVGEKGVYADLSAYEMQKKRFEDSHLIKQNLPREIWEKMTPEEREAMPIVGNMRRMVFDRNEIKPQGTAELENEEDDLPF